MESWVVPLKAEIDAQRPVRRWRLRLEIALDPGRPGEVVALRVAARVVRHQEAVAGRERDAGSRRMGRARPDVGQLVSSREFAEPDEVRFLDVAVLRARGG